MATHQIFQFHAQLRGYPAVWRRFQLLCNAPLSTFSYTLMVLFEMLGNRPFCLNIPVMDNYIARNGSMENYPPDLPERVRFEVPSPGFLDRPEDGTRVMHAAHFTLLSCRMLYAGDKLELEYDPEKGWAVDVVVEKVFLDPAFPSRLIPRVTEGTGYGILEDCESPARLQETIEAYMTRRSPLYDEIAFALHRNDADLYSTDLDDLTYRIRHVPRILGYRYERQIQPTTRDLYILERHYLKSRKFQGAHSRVLTFRVRLLEYSPAMWRDVQIRANASIADLSCTVLALFGLSGSPGASFCTTIPVWRNLETRNELTAVTRAQYPERTVCVLPDAGGGLPDLADGFRPCDATVTRLNSVFVRVPGDSLLIRYDSAGTWHFEATLTDTVPGRQLTERDLPRVLDGAGYGVVENCGGPGELARLAELLTSGNRQEADRARRKYGLETWYLNAFDLETAAKRMNTCYAALRKLWNLASPEGGKKSRRKKGSGEAG